MEADDREQEDVLVVEYEATAAERVASLLNDPIALACAVAIAVCIWRVFSCADAFVAIGSFYVARRISQPWCLDERR